MYKLPARFKHDSDGGFVVTFRDIPEAITQGDTMEEAQQMAADALLTAMDFYFDDNRQVPQPSAVLIEHSFILMADSQMAMV